MTEGNIVRTKQTSMGDDAVDRLLGGVGAGLVMAAYLAAAALLTGTSVTTTFARFAVESSASSPLSGMLLHLAVSGVYGLPFGVAAGAVLKNYRLWIGRVVAGMVYSALSFAVARLLILLAVNSPLSQLPELQFALAHGVYMA